MGGEKRSSIPGLAGLLRQRIGDDHPGYLFEDRQWTWDEVVRESADRGAVLQAILDWSQPAHVGLLLDNSPEYLFWIGGASFCGATIVGINPTRRGAELARDIAHTDCQWIVTDTEHLSMFEGVDLASIGLEQRMIVLDQPGPTGAELIDAHRTGKVPDDDPDPSHRLLLLFTSGSTSAPKAVICSSRRLAGAGIRASAGYGITRSDISYCPMPMFHGNALMACWAPSLAQGATVAIRRKFSASGFGPDVRGFDATFFTYVGRTIAYILAQPPSALDTQNNLRMGFGTEASGPDRDNFEARFGCPLVEGYGSSESVVSIALTPDTPKHALGKPNDPTADVAVIDPATGIECRPARFDEDGKLLNASEATGEIVRRSGASSFEGYYNNEEATSDRLRNGWYWTGDLAYRDADGFFYFAGRSADWLRVDSENFAAAPIERILSRYPDMVMVAVYPVPDPRTGDQAMATFELQPGATFDPDAFTNWLFSQPDLGTKWAPRFIRITESMPLTANNKVHKPPLRKEAWECTDPVWWLPSSQSTPDGTPAVYQPLTAQDRHDLRAAFVSYNRSHHAPMESVDAS